MKKKTLAYALLFLLSISIIGFNFLDVVRANGFHGPFVPQQPITNKPMIALSTIINNSLAGKNATMTFNIIIPDSWNWHDNLSPTHEYITFVGTISEVKCTVDGNVVYDNKTVLGYNANLYYGIYNSSITSPVTYDIILNSLHLGAHSTVTTVSASTIWMSPNGITANYHYYDVSTSSTDTLMVCTLPAILNLSLENRTYRTSEIPFTFNVNETTPWLGYSWAGYSLDNQANVTAFENATLTNLEEGNHSLVVFANDTFGNMGKSDTVFFSIELPTSIPTPSPSPAISPTLQPTLEPSITSNPIIDNNSALVILVIAIPILLLIIGLAVYIRKRRK